MRDWLLDNVEEFHRRFGAHISPSPHVPEVTEGSEINLINYASEMAELARNLKVSAAGAAGAGDRGGALTLIRLQLIQEELAELADALSRRDLVDCLDALCDLDYVVAGTYLTLGLQDRRRAAGDEVHRSNMSKLGADGHPIISAAGRVVKGPNYSSPDLAKFLKE